MKRFPWMTVGLAALFAAASFPDGTSLQYERYRVAEGEAWRLLTGQMIHWTPRMALFDLGMLLGLGAWLEIRGDRRLAAISLALGAVFTAAAVHLSDLSLYRGSSGMASTLFVLAAFRIADSPDRWTRTLALAAVALFLAKAAYEFLAGQTLFAGDLPEGVRVVPLVHLLGGLAGAGVPRLRQRKQAGRSWRARTSRRSQAQGSACGRARPASAAPERTR